MSPNKETNPASAESQRAPGSGVHVDVENLYLNAQFVIHELVNKWPQEKAPPPSHLNLYVTADQSELWKTWAESRFPTLNINVLGTQRFSMAPTKNSADITLVLTAAIDLVTKKVDHIVLVSNDSDYIALHAAIRDHQETPSKDGATPFLWVMTDEEKRISRTVHSSSHRSRSTPLHFRTTCETETTTTTHIHCHSIRPQNLNKPNRSPFSSPKQGTG